MNTLHNFDEVFDTQRVFRKLLEAMAIREELFRYQKKRTGFSETSHHFLQLQ